MRRYVSDKTSNALDTLRQEISSHPLTKGLEVDDFDVNLVYNYLLDMEKCKGCKGLNVCKQDTTGYQPVLEKSPYLSVELKPCDYKKADMQMSKVHGKITTLYLSDDLLKAELSKFELLNEERTKALKYASLFASTYTSNTSVKSMYLYGTFRTGKTYLLAAVANKLASRDVKTMLVYFPDLVRHLKSAIHSGELENRIEELKQIDVLMLDDIGSENLTTWVRDEILGPILQYRLSAKLPVFFSSNLSIKELALHLNQTKDGESDPLKGYRILERIMALCEEFKLNEKRYIK